MDDPAQHPEVVRVVDHCLDPQRPTFVEVLDELNRRATALVSGDFDSDTY